MCGILISTSDQIVDTLMFQISRRGGDFQTYGEVSNIDSGSNQYTVKLGASNKPFILELTSENVALTPDSLKDLGTSEDPKHSIRPAIHEPESSFQAPKVEFSRNCPVFVSENGDPRIDRCLPVRVRSMESDPGMVETHVNNLLCLIKLHISNRYIPQIPQYRPLLVSSIDIDLYLKALTYLLKELSVENRAIIPFESTAQPLSDQLTILETPNYHKAANLSTRWVYTNVRLILEKLYVKGSERTHLSISYILRQIARMSDILNGKHAISFRDVFSLIIDHLCYDLSIRNYFWCHLPMKTHIESHSSYTKYTIMDDNRFSLDTLSVKTPYIQSRSEYTKGSGIAEKKVSQCKLLKRASFADSQCGDTKGFDIIQKKVSECKLLKRASFVDSCRGDTKGFGIIQKKVSECELLLTAAVADSQCGDTKGSGTTQKKVSECELSETATFVDSCRGDTKHSSISEKKSHRKLYFFSSVLSLQGSIHQPIDCRIFFLYNGEIYSGTEPPDTILIHSIIKSSIRRYESLKPDSIRDMDSSQRDYAKKNFCRNESAKGGFTTSKSQVGVGSEYIVQKQLKQLKHQNPSVNRPIGSLTTESSPKMDLNARLINKTRSRTIPIFPFWRTLARKEHTDFALIDLIKPDTGRHQITAIGSQKTSVFPLFIICEHILEDILYEAEFALVFLYSGFLYFFKDDIGRRSFGFTFDDHFTLSSSNFQNELDSKYFYAYDITNHRLYRKLKKSIIRWHRNRPTGDKYSQIHLNVEHTHTGVHEPDFVDPTSRNCSKSPPSNSVSALHPLNIPMGAKPPTFCLEGTLNDTILSSNVRNLINNEPMQDSAALSSTNTKQFGLRIDWLDRKLGNINYRPLYSFSRYDPKITPGPVSGNAARIYPPLNQPIIRKCIENFQRYSEVQKHSKATIRPQNLGNIYSICRKPLPNTLEAKAIELWNLLLTSSLHKIPHRSVSVLFSGGIDSIIITLIIIHHLPLKYSIYLINTSIESKSFSKDRKLGYKAFNAIKEKYPMHKLFFIENNISKQDYQQEIDTVLDLCAPKTTKMDFNIGVCLYFSAKRASQYSKVVFSGSGADELFCGYKNHQLAVDLRNRILCDIAHIYERNLGRDDRVISYHNIELRHIFLDTQIVDFVLNLDTKYFMDGDRNKILLREILKLLNFDSISETKKLAMQFGSGLNKWEHVLYVR